MKCELKHIAHDYIKTVNSYPFGVRIIAVLVSVVAIWAMIAVSVWIPIVGSLIIYGNWYLEAKKWCKLHGKTT